MRRRCMVYMPRGWSATIAAFWGNDMTSTSPLIALDRRKRKPIYQQIYEGFRAGILDGALTPGQPIPSTRALAVQLDVSRFPVLNAYSQLHAEGYFESTAGAGTFVATSLKKVRRANSTAPARAPRQVARRAESIPSYVKPTWRALGAFQVGQPDL